MVLYNDWWCELRMRRKDIISEGHAFTIHLTDYKTTLSTTHIIQPYLKTCVGDINQVNRNHQGP